MIEGHPWFRKGHGMGGCWSILHYLELRVREATKLNMDNISTYFMNTMKFQLSFSRHSMSYLFISIRSFQVYSNGFISEIKIFICEMSNSYSKFNPLDNLIALAC